MHVLRNSLTGDETARVLGRLGARDFVCQCARVLIDKDAGWAGMGGPHSDMYRHNDGHSLLLSYVLARRVGADDLTAWHIAAYPDLGTYYMRYPDQEIPRRRACRVG